MINALDSTLTSNSVINWKKNGNTCRLKTAVMPTQSPTQLRAAGEQDQEVPATTTKLVGTVAVVIETELTDQALKQLKLGLKEESQP